MNRFFGLLLGALAMVSCTDCLTPEGEMVERNMEIPADADGVEVADGMHLVFSENVPAGHVVVRTHGNVQPYVVAEVHGGRILFRVDARRFKNLDVTLTTSPDPYRHFTASGGSRMHLPDELSLPQATCTVSGGSEASMALVCENLAVDCSGGSELVCTGRCDVAGIVCSGGSRFLGYDLPIRTASVEVSGGSSLELTVSESLTGENSGGSTIFCKGDPAILTVNNTGGSTVVRP